MPKHVNDQLLRSFTYLSSSGSGTHSAWAPNTDVYEKAGSLVVRMELAGIKREDLEIMVTDRLLLVHGQRKDPCRQGRCSFRQVEIDYGYFERRIVFPGAVDARHAKARLQNGFLQIELPKTTQSEPMCVTVIIEHHD